MTPVLKFCLTPCNNIYKEQQMIGGWRVYKKVLLIPTSNIYKEQQMIGGWRVYKKVQLIPTSSLKFSQAERTLIPR